MLVNQLAASKAGIIGFQNQLIRAGPVARSNLTPSSYKLK